MFPATLQASQYSHRILVSMDNQVIIFEPDEERNYRAILQDADTNVNIALVQSIALAIESVFK